MSLRIACVVALFAICMADVSWAQGRQFNLANALKFGGPDAVENQLEDDKQDWGVWKKELEVNHGLTFGFDYTAIFLSASDTSANDTSAGGIARLFGRANLTKNGALIFKFEYRHEFGSPAPAGFALSELGYAGVIGRPFEDSEFGTHNLYWRQRMNGGRATLIAGVLDATDYVDAFAFSSPWRHFMNMAFSTGSAAISLPNDAAVGAAYGTMLGKGAYLIAGLTDANGDPDDPFQGLSNFFSDNEYFKSIELGWTSSPRRVALNNIHVTAWHKDRQSVAGIPDGWGMAFSLSGYLNKNFMPFVRGGYAQDGGSLLQKSLSLGLGYRTDAFDGLFGAGINWGDPNEATFGQGLQDQWAVEVFYRLPLGRYFAVTGDVQYIKDPALNPIQNTMWMFNLRARASF